MCAAISEFAAALLGQLCARQHLISTRKSKNYDQGDDAKTQATFILHQDAFIDLRRLDFY
jgi:hypothetical protein